MKGPSWSCELCHNRSNPSRSFVCTICSAPRPQHRFGLNVDGHYFLCKTRIISFVPSITVCSVSIKSCDYFTINFDESDSTVEETIVDSVREHLRAAAEIEQSAEIGFPELNIEPQNEDTFNSNFKPGLTSSPIKRTKWKQDGTPKGIEKSGSFIGMLDSGLSLFDTVMQNASTVAYDGKIGQYVSVKTVKHSFEDPSEMDSMIKKDLSYVESMKKERIVMTQVVNEVVRRRADDTYLYDANSDLDINRNEWDKRAECTMCERNYPKSQMPGQITFKAIVDWREQRGVPFSPTDHRMDRIRLHDAVRLCSFCTQFFDANAVDLVDKQALKEKIGVAHIGLNGPLNCSNTVYKRLFRKAVTLRPEIEDRPLSRMRHRVALEQLRFKAQMKNDPKARYMFNPKFPNLVLDQEKVGKFLRTKYSESAVRVPIA